MGKEMGIKSSIIMVIIWAIVGCAGNKKPAEIFGEYRQVNKPGSAFIDDIERSGGASGDPNIFKAEQKPVTDKVKHHGKR